MDIELLPDQKIYFASDFHLGHPSFTGSRGRERKIIQWLDDVSEDAGHIFLMGDLFDFWYEFKHVVPKGYVRFLGKLAAFVDAGLPVTVFTGNHDMWMYGYFTEELGIPVYHDPQELRVSGKRMLIGHGDGLGPGDNFYKFLKKIFRNRFARFAFNLVHPDLGLGFGYGWSQRSKKRKMEEGQPFKGDKEYIWSYCKAVEQQQHYDYYVFGHRHLALDLAVGQNSRYVNLGEWLTLFSYAAFDGDDLRLLTFHQEKGRKQVR